MTTASSTPSKEIEDVLVCPITVKEVITESDSNSFFISSVFSGGKYTNSKPQYNMIKIINETLLKSGYKTCVHFNRVTEDEPDS